MAKKYTIGPDIDLDAEEVAGKHGRYTEADARADADAFERRGGRPSLGAGVSPQIAFRVAPATKAALRAAAAEQGRTEAAVARAALEEYLHRAS